MNKRLEKPKTKRYNLKMPDELFAELKLIADKKQTPVVEMLKRFIKLGLLIESSPNASFYVKENGKEREILLL